MAQVAQAVLAARVAPELRVRLDPLVRPAHPAERVAPVALVALVALAAQVEQVELELWVRLVKLEERAAQVALVE